MQPTEGTWPGVGDPCIGEMQSRIAGDSPVGFSDCKVVLERIHMRADRRNSENGLALRRNPH